MLTHNMAKTNEKPNTDLSKDEIKSLSVIESEQNKVVASMKSRNDETKKNEDFINELSKTIKNKRALRLGKK